ncbi:MAG: hypothetical protein FWD78_08610 [Treponema sp.]|nr:hypothetical protein [Treponema sp.]
MKKTFLLFISVFLLLGLIIAGCSIPAGPAGAGTSRAVINVNGIDIDTEKTYTVRNSGWNQVVIAGSGQQNIVEFSLMDGNPGPVAATAWCGDLNTTVQSYYKLTTLTSTSLYGSDTALKLQAALTYIYNNYGDMRENSPLSYNALVQGVIWNITNNAVITGINGNGYLGDLAWQIQDNAKVIPAITDVLANYARIINDYDNGVTINYSQAVINGNLFGPCIISENSLFPGMVYALTVDRPVSAFFEDADGNVITEAAAGLQFYVRFAAGSFGEFNFNAAAVGSRDYLVVNNILVWYSTADAADLDKDHAHQPLFQPLFTPLVSTETLNKMYSCGGRFSVTPPAGNINIVKTVDGVNIFAWAGVNNCNVYDLISAFNIYSTDKSGGLLGELRGTGNVDNQGVLSFSNLQNGWYAIEEILTSKGAKVFARPEIMYVQIENSVQVSGNASFDYNSLYTIWYTINGWHQLNYPGLNGGGEIFPIKVFDETGTEYASFCGNAGSTNFDEGPGNYMIAERIDRGTALYADFISAMNYIEDRYGNLALYRPVTQIVIWELLGAIDVNSNAFNSINWAAIEAGTSTVMGVPSAEAIIKDVITNYKGYRGRGRIADIAFMVSKNVPGPEGYVTRQPQYVPIYNIGESFNNMAIPPPPVIRPVSPAYSSVTATNTGNVKMIIAGLNKQNGNPYFNDKKGNPDTPFVVPNSNHFVYAKLDRTDLEKGLLLDLVVGNKYQIVGKAEVKLVNGNLVIKVADMASGSLGAIAFNKLPVINNGNIHSAKAADLAKFGAVTGFKHDSNLLIPCRPGSTIYLYIHFDSLKFYL